jgi:hypothetical protein
MVDCAEVGPYLDKGGGPGNCLCAAVKNIFGKALPGEYLWVMQLNPDERTRNWGAVD